MSQPPSFPLNLTPAARPLSHAPIVDADVRASADLDLEPCPSSPQCGHTDTAVEVSLDSRSAQTLTLFQQYVRAMNARASDALRPLLADVITAITPNPRGHMAFAREQVVSLHSDLFDTLDPRGFDAHHVRVLSAQECQRLSDCNVNLLDDDYLVEWQSTSYRVTPMPRLREPPRRIIVRWHRGRGLVVAFAHDFLLPRGP